MERTVSLRFLLCVLMGVSVVVGYSCIHDHIGTDSNVQQIVDYSYNTRRSIEERSANRKNIRITLDTSRVDTTAQLDSNYTCYSAGNQVTLQDGTSYTCTQDDVLTPSKASFLVDKLLTLAVAKLESALLVDPVEGNLLVPSTLKSCYSGSIAKLIPDNKYYNIGAADTDLLVFVTARRIVVANVLAFASSCAQDQNKRNTIGFINFNPADLTESVDANYATKFGATIHELTHVLGFSSSKFGDFIDAYNQSIPKSQVVKTETSTATGQPVLKLITPKVVQKIRDHFSCSSLDGAELENQGENGTAYSHWEKRIFGNEYLVGVVTDKPVFSQMTLAYFEDSGWYDVDYGASSPLLWGYHLGCDWVNKKCNTWTAENYYCTDTSTKTVGCTFDRIASASCNLVDTYTAIPTYYQYFQDSNKGGADQYADYCPYVQSTTTNGAMYCFDTSKQSSLLNSGEKFCETCRCFDTTLLKKSPVALPTTDYGCYDVACTSTTSLKVKIGDWHYDCPKGGSVESPYPYTGTLQCPKTDVLCAGAATDTTWPTITSIDPNEGAPSDQVTIYGSNFVDGMTAVINEPCTDCQVVDSNTLKCKVAPSSSFTNPDHLFGSSQDVAVVAPDGRSAVKQGAFYLKKSIFSIFGASSQNVPVISLILALLVLCIFM